MARPRHERPAHVAHRALAAGAPRLGALGRALGERGLRERAVLACFGVRAVVHIERRVAGAPTPDPLPPAAVAPWLLAAGRPIAVDSARRGLGEVLDQLVAVGLVHGEGDVVVPRLRLVPVGRSICACPAAAPGHGGNPDDSSAHLVGALPHARVDRWLDLGTGNGYAPLAAADRAREILATDVDDDALACAALGVALSGLTAVRLAKADLFAGVDPGARWDRITFNAPIPGAGDDILDRFAAAAPAALTAGGEVLLHARAGADDPWCRLDGEVTIARYTPDEVAPAFAVIRWRPGRARRIVEVRCTLRPDAPHIDRAWLPDAG